MRTVRGIFIPSSSSELIREITFDHIDYTSVAKILSDDVHRTEYIERVSTSHLFALDPNIRMYVDEEGLLKNFPANIRAGRFYPYGTIAGNALLLGEGEVMIDGYPEVDITTLPDRVTLELVKNFLQISR